MYRFKTVETEEELKSIFKLRYEVYCKEKQWLDSKEYPDKQETDRFDVRSKHFIAIDNKDNVIGTIRLILTKKPEDDLPICSHPGLGNHLSNTNRSAEISRLAVTSSARNGDVALGLYRIMYSYSKNNGLETWFVCTDSLFLKLLNGLGFPFKAIGETGNYFGETLPALLDIEFVDKSLQKQNPSFFQWFQEDPSEINSKNILQSVFGREIKPQKDGNPLFSRNWAYISPEVQSSISKTRLLLAGTGLGSTIAELAARTGFERFILADGDVVELSNLNRQSFSNHQLNVNKAKATGEMIHGINPNAEVEIVEKYLDEHNLEELIEKSDIIVNTIDFDSPAFLACNKAAFEHKKTVLFPINIGWGGALYIFTYNSPNLAEILEIDLESCSLKQIKEKLILHLLGSKPPSYLLPLAMMFGNSSEKDWPNDPQLAAGAHLVSSLAVTAAVLIVSGEPVKTAPDFTYIDLHESLVPK